MIVAVDSSASMSSKSPAFTAPQAMTTESHPGKNNMAKNRKEESKEGLTFKSEGKKATKKSSGKKDEYLQKQKVVSSSGKRMLDGNKVKDTQAVRGAFKSSIQSKPVRVLFIFSKISTPTKKATLKLKQQ